MNNYELTYIISNQYTEEEVSKIKDKVDQLLTNNQAIIGYQELMGKKKLAYPINHVSHGYYISAEFEMAEPKDMKKIDNILKLDKEILRHLIIKKHKITEAEITRKNKRQKSDDENEFDGSETKKEKKPIKTKKVSANPKSTRIQLDEKIDEILEEKNII